MADPIIIFDTNIKIGSLVLKREWNGSHSKHVMRMRRSQEHIHNSIMLDPLTHNDSILIFSTDEILCYSTRFVICIVLSLQVSFWFSVSSSIYIDMHS